MVFELMPNNGTWTEKALHWFKRDGEGGSYPNATPILDKSGNVYGTTAYGGNYRHGTVFELTPANRYWMEKALHSFNTDSKGGYAPTGALILDGSGNLSARPLGRHLQWRHRFRVVPPATARGH